MSSRNSVALATALAVLLLAATAVAEPTPIRITKQVTCQVDNKSIVLDPGRYLPEPDWLKLDQEVIRLQNSETRLKAENTELSKPDPMSWKLILGATLVGIAAGAFAFRN